MKTALTSLFFYHAIQVVLSASAFDLYDTMDDARSAIMSFYDPTLVEPKVTPKVKPVTTLRPDQIRITTSSLGSSSLGSSKRWRVLGKKIAHGKSRLKGSLGGRKLSKMSTKRFGPIFSKHVTHRVAVGPIFSKYVPHRVAGVSMKSLSLKPFRPFSIVPTYPLPTLKKVLKKAKPVTSKRVSLNKFAEAIEDIEKALADAQIVGRVRHNEQRLRKLRNLIRTAVQKRSYRFARKAIGEAMFTIRKINEQRKRGGRGKRNTVLSSKAFLGSVRQTIGVSAFNDLLAMQGQVTLMFAIDDTGSMKEEIAAAKSIATSIVNEQRAEPVDYILSPFNDPGTGPVTYCSETEKERFVNAIAGLHHHSGGDCPELTYKGIRNAMEENPQSDSPLYVFTDAGPKDATEENLLYVQKVSQALGFVINFFVVQNTGCARSADISSFQETAQATMGQVFELKNHQELEQLEGMTATSLGGTAIVANGIQNQSARKKRSTSQTQNSNFPIPIDDSIDTVVISVTADQPSAGGNTWSVSLTSPTGTIAGVTTNNLDQGTVYQISRPNVGVWNLGVTAVSNVNYNFFVKGSSANNIDFEYYFVRTKVRRGVSTTVPIASPVLGAQAEAILTLGGVDHVDLRTLRAELVTLQGDVITTSRPVSLTSKDRKGIRYSFKFYPPNQVFKIKLKGRTKKGNSFERICHSPIKPESLVVKVLFARNDYTMSQGGTGYVIFMIENFGNDEVVDMTSFGSFGTVERQSRAMNRVRKGRQTTFSVTFRGNTKAVRGVTVTIVVSVKGRRSGSKSVMSVPLLVV